MLAWCDGGGDNIHKSNFYCSFRIEDYVERFYDLRVRSVNESEYLALIYLLEYLYKNNIQSEIEIHSDSALVVNQVNKVWKVRAKNLLPYLVRINNLLEHLPNIKISWVSRKEIVRVLGH